MNKKRICINVPKYLDRETAEFLLNNESYFLISLAKSEICYNANTKICKKCEEPECDLAEGWRRNEKEA